MYAWEGESLARLINVCTEEEKLGEAEGVDKERA